MKFDSQRIAINVQYGGMEEHEAYCISLRYFMPRHLTIAMGSAPGFTVVTLPKQFIDDVVLKRLVDKYRELRLQSLRSDPDSFSSNFDIESKQPFNFWMGRLMSSRAQHFLATRLAKDCSATFVAHDFQPFLETEWIGILVSPWTDDSCWS